MDRKLTLEDVRGDSLDNGSFKKMQDYARAVTKNEEGFHRKMTTIVWQGLKKFHQKKAQGTRKRKAVDKEKVPSSKRKEFDEEISTLKEKGVEMVMVAKKTLTDSDVKDQNSRLSLPGGKIMTEILSAEERGKMETRTQDGGPFQGMEILLIEPSLEVPTIVLNRWKIGKGFSYVLCSTWNEVREHNGLDSGDTVEVWSFKLGGNLGLVLYTP